MLKLSLKYNKINILRNGEFQIKLIFDFNKVYINSVEIVKYLYISLKLLSYVLRICFVYHKPHEHDDQ